MDIRDICIKYLEKNGYDGLCSGDCACLISDLMPCGEPNVNCDPGYKIPCPGPESCPNDGDCPWHITTKKPNMPGESPTTPKGD